MRVRKKVDMPSRARSVDPSKIFWSNEGPKKSRLGFGVSPTGLMFFFEVISREMGMKIKVKSSDEGPDEPRTRPGGVAERDPTFRIHLA